MKLDAKSAPAHWYLGIIYLSQKQRGKAVAEIEQASKLGAGTPIGKLAKDKLNELSKQK